MIKVLLFADLEEKAGKREIELSVDSMTIDEVRTILLEMYPAMTRIQNAMPAVNEEYAEDKDIVKSGDTVAFIPPVSGG
ncbi:molybdopterin converting factor subunit 1 [Evansella sp. AB-rgal1]|uniref:molybdopterin converting factor subunit 1 n=1 Tax=Evansella sp. AB-rgal1 TaxID=3242696 RepID=UPI00359DA1B3